MLLNAAQFNDIILQDCFNRLFQHTYIVAQRDETTLIRCTLIPPPN